MEKRKLGRTGLNVSVLTFGCGAVGGLMTAARRPIRSARSRARSKPASIISTPRATYGDGASEENLGRVLASLKPDVIVSHQGARAGASGRTSAPRSRLRSRRA